MAEEGNQAASSDVLTIDQIKPGDSITVDRWLITYSDEDEPDQSWVGDCLKVLGVAGNKITARAISAPWIQSFEIDSREVVLRRIDPSQTTSP